MVTPQDNTLVFKRDTGVYKGMLYIDLRKHSFISNLGSESDRVWCAMLQLRTTRKGTPVGGRGIGRDGDILLGVVLWAHPAGGLGGEPYKDGLCGVQCCCRCKGWSAGGLGGGHSGDNLLCVRRRGRSQQTICLALIQTK